LAATSTTLAQTVIQNSNLHLGPPGPGNDFDGANYGLTVYKDAAATDSTSVFGIYNQPRIQVVNFELDQGSDWYVVHPGDTFDTPHIEAGAFTPLIEVPHTPGATLLYPTADVGQSDFWLGVTTGYALFGPRTVFGWVRLRPLSNSQLMMVENAVSYNSRGIVVGTTNLVPEPTVMVLIAFSFCAAPLGRLRRK
jgi:hypothetical protein